MSFFKNITLNDWRQFGGIDIDLSKKVTVLTGQNGSGKTTLLNILIRHFGWGINFVSTPFWGKKKSKRFWSDVMKSRSLELEGAEKDSCVIGRILYSAHPESVISTSSIVGAQYQLSFSHANPIAGLHIPSHRPPTVYTPISQIPTNPADAHTQFQSFSSLAQQTFNQARISKTTGSVLKESLISFALFGYGNNAVQENRDYIKIFEGFQEILRKVLPSSLGFQKLEVRMPEVVVTESGDFSLDAMSGGIASLFSTAWQIYMHGLAENDGCTITMDEPENHLHPSMQRTLIPCLVDAFPTHRFIVATHSPYIVSSYQDASVYGLVYSPNRRVNSTKLNVADVSGTPNQVLREVLDVPSNLPVWVEEMIRDVMAQHENSPDDEKAEGIMSKLKELGLTNSLPEYRTKGGDAKTS